MPRFCTLVRSRTRRGSNEYPLWHEKLCTKKSLLVDVSDLFYFFSVPGRAQGRRRSRRFPGWPVLIKIEGMGGGGLSEEEAREREGRRGNVCGEVVGGAKYFFSGPKCPPSYWVF